MCIGGHDVFDFVLCPNKLSVPFLAPVSFFLFSSSTVEICFSVLSCRGLSLTVYSDAPLTYVLYQFFLNCSHFSSKSIKKSYSKKRLNAFGQTCWKLNNIRST